MWQASQLPYPPAVCELEIRIEVLEAQCHQDAHEKAAGGCELVSVIDDAVPEAMPNVSQKGGHSVGLC